MACYDPLDLAFHRHEAGRGFNRYPSANGDLNLEALARVKRRRLEKLRRIPR
jgi:hypothetical protein